MKYWIMWHSLKALGLKNSNSFDDENFHLSSNEVKESIFAIVWASGEFLFLALIQLGSKYYFKDIKKFSKVKRRKLLNRNTL